MKAKKFVQSFGKDGQIAIELELSNMMKKGVFKPILYENLSDQDKANIIPCFIFLKQKFSPAGKAVKIKARLVAGGNYQDKNLFPDTSSPTAQIDHIFIEVTIASARGDFIVTLDIGTAYLNADMCDNVYMTLDRKLARQFVEMYPEYASYVSVDGKIIVKLEKALYGCLQSALLWYNCLKNALTKIGFTTNPYDDCIFTKSSEGNYCTIIVYVDDLMIISNDKTLIDDVIKYLQDEFKEITVNRGNTHSYLGMEFVFKEGQVEIKMKGYIENLLNENNIESTCVTPAGEDLFNLKDEPLLSSVEQKSLHSLIAKLLYLSTRVRPDILLPVNFLSTRVNKYNASDKEKMMRILKYLNSTRDIGLILRCNDPKKIEVTTYADASYGIHNDGKGQTGITTSLGIGSIHSSTNKQKLVAKSSSEAELIASSDGVSHLIKVENYLKSRNYVIEKLSLQQDNLSTKSIIQNGVRSAKRMRHLNIRYFFVKQYVEDHGIGVEYTKTTDMLADLFTKPLQGQQFISMRDRVLGLVPTYEESD
jgi:hypothetical protein